MLLLGAESGPGRGVVLKIVRRDIFLGSAPRCNKLLRRIVRLASSKEWLVRIQLGAVAKPERIRDVQLESDLSADKRVLEAIIAGRDPNDLGGHAIDLIGLHSVYIGLYDL